VVNRKVFRFGLKRKETERGAAPEGSERPRRSKMELFKALKTV